MSKLVLRKKRRRLDGKDGVGGEDSSEEPRFGDESDTESEWTPE